MENRLDEFASIMDWVDDRALEPKWRLTPWHAAYIDGTKEISDAWLELSAIKNPREDFLKNLDSPKLVELRNIISQIVIEQGRKVIIFSQWKRIWRK